jgi:DNA polymerase II large subunit
LAKKYAVSPYLSQTIALLQKRIDDVFGKEKEKQAGLADWC